MTGENRSENRTVTGENRSFETRIEERESKVTGENRNENRTGDRGESSFGVEIDSSGLRVRRKHLASRDFETTNSFVNRRFVEAFFEVVLHSSLF